MRSSWRQPAMVLFAVASGLLVVLVIWWGVFFSNRVDDLHQGEIDQLQVTALTYLATFPEHAGRALDDIEAPAGLEAVPREGNRTTTASFAVGFPGSDWVLVPSTARAAEIEASFQRKRVMILGEGSLLLLLVLVSLWAIYANNRRALRMNSEMGNFIQAITHELKTPLASLRLLLETLKENPQAIPDQEAALEAGLVQTQRLERLITNVLHASALEGHRLRVARQPFDLSREIRVFCLAREAAVKAAGGTLTFDTPEPVIIRFDQSALRLVLDNLLDNAIKYSPDGPRVVIASRAADPDAILTVTDQGIGMTPEVAAQVFERFWRAGDELTRTSEGTGLGLYLVRRIISVVSGRVTATSPGPGQGSTIEVRLPLGSLSEVVPERDIIPGG